MTITDEEVIRRLNEFAGHARTRPHGPPLYLSDEVPSGHSRTALRRGGLAAAALAVAAAAVTLVALLGVGQHTQGRVTASSVPGTHPNVPTNPAGQQPPVPVGPAAVSVIAAPPIPGSTNPQSGIWTGSQWIVLGPPIAAYTPGTGWALLPAAPVAFSSPFGVWTGSELLVFNATGPGQPAPGAAYNPATRTWTAVPAPPMWLAGLSMAVWTGTEALIVSATNENAYTTEAYDPASNDWHLLASSPGGLSPGVAWSGSVLYGVVDAGPFATRSSGPVQSYGALVSFDPVQNRWQKIQSPTTLSSSVATVAWYNDRILVFPANSDPNLEYFPATNTWRPLAQAEINWLSTSAADSIWTGTQEIFIGTHQLVIYDAASDIWEAATVSDGHGGPAGFFVDTWAGHQLYLWPESPSEALAITLPPGTP